VTDLRTRAASGEEKVIDTADDDVDGYPAGEHIIESPNVATADEYTDSFEAADRAEVRISDDDFTLKCSRIRFVCR
jgi:hypothetical protein